MADENVITRITDARRDLGRMRSMVERCFAILCSLTSWNPKEGLTEEELADLETKPHDPSYVSQSRELVKLRDEDLEDARKARATVDAATIETCKAYAKKIAQLTHPDKIMRFSAHTKAQLLDLFHHSHEDLADNNHAGLVYAYVHIRILRGESRHVDPALFDVMEAEYNWLNQQIQFILKQKYIPAANAYCDGKIPIAKVLFLEYIEKVRAERKLKRELNAMQQAAQREAADRYAEGAEGVEEVLELFGELQHDA